MIKIIKVMLFGLSLLSIFHMETRAMENLPQKEAKESYGGAQGNLIFQEDSKKVINLASVQIGKLINFAKERNKELFSLHNAFLGSKESKKGLAYQRYNIAQKTASKTAEQFGLLRTSPAAASLHISPVTDSWRANFFSYYSKFLKENIHALKIGETYFWETPDKINCCMIDLIPREKWELPIPDEIVCYEKLGVFYPGMHPDANKRYEELVNKKNKVMAITFMLNSNVEGKNIDLTQFYTWVETDKQSSNGLSIENIDNIEKFSNVIARHTAKKDIDFLLNKAAKLWAQAILGDPGHRDILIQNLGEYAYLMSHAMPFCRGSAAIMEWSIKSVCCFHQLDFFYQGALDQDALLSPFPKEFLEHFESHVTLNPL